MGQPCMPNKKSNHMKLRSVLVCCLVVSVLFSSWSVYQFLQDKCGGRQYTVQLCSKYKAGVITGALCPKLCDEKTVQLTKCLHSDAGLKTFYSNSRVIKLHTITDHDFAEPKSGTSMEQFSAMVEGFLTAKLGKGNHKALLEHILNTADINSDSKVTLAEAKTIWSLLQYNEFFMLNVFHDTELVPKLMTFCGDLYATEHIQYEKLYAKNSGIWDRLLPNQFQWTLPSWKNRAKIAVGLLEFIMIAYHHEDNGMFYMCDIGEYNMGYTGKYDVKFTDLSQVLPRSTLIEYMKAKPCSDSEDCMYTKQCISNCNRDTKTCSGVPIRPNLHRACVILREYIIVGAPPVIKQDLQKLLSRCLLLHTDLNDVEMEHSLILNELKSLIWNQVDS